MEAMLENRGENAYSTVLNISFSRNLQFASLIPKVRCWELWWLGEGLPTPCTFSSWLPQLRNKQIADRGVGAVGGSELPKELEVFGQ